jgi:two-component system sensor histidine kinase KdpD
MPKRNIRYSDFRLTPYLVSAGMVVAATAASYLIEPIILPSNLSLVFLTAVLFSAMLYGLWPSILASLLSELSWNFFFLPPKYSLAIDDPQDLLALILFLVVSLVVSNLAALQLRQSEVLAARARMTEQLYIFSQNIATAGSLDEALEVIAQNIGATLHCDVVVLLAEDCQLKLRAKHPADQFPDNKVMTEATSAFISTVLNGSIDTIPDSCYLYLPLRTRAGTIGVIGIRRTLAPYPAPPLDEPRLLSILCDQAAFAIERTQLTETIDRARLETETERLRNAMLTSVSHDLRTPLTTIIAAHSMLKSLGAACSESMREELVDRAQVEAERLNRFIGNLLDMTKLESGKMPVSLGPVDVGDAIDAALTRARHLTANHRIARNWPGDLPMATADFMLLEQALFNVIDNAARYSPPRTTISVSAMALGGSLIIKVTDEGEGIPPDMSEIIFDKFARLKLEDSQRPGTGLGLAICRGFLQAMSGTIAAGNRIDGPGAAFTLTLPRFAPSLAELELAKAEEIS